MKQSHDSRSYSLPDFDMKNGGLVFLSHAFDVRIFGRTRYRTAAVVFNVPHLRDKALAHEFLERCVPFTPFWSFSGTQIQTDWSKLDTPIGHAVALENHEVSKKCYGAAPIYFNDISDDAHSAFSEEWFSR